MPNNITAELRAWHPQKTESFMIYWGDIYGDTKCRWEDGETIHTSAVLSYEETSDAFIVTTRNSIYELKKDQSLKALINKKDDGDGAGETRSSEASV